MKIISTISLIIFATFTLQAQNDALFKQANEQYSEGKFAAAIKNYEKIIESGFESGELYYNIGNACYRSSKFTDAIYYYEKSKMLTPNNDDLKHNLDMAQLQIYDKIKPVPKIFILRYFDTLVKSRSANSWAFISLFIFVLMIAGGLTYFFSRKRKLKVLSFMASIILLAFTVTTYIFSKKQFNNLTAHKTAIIYSPSVSVKSSPDDNATELFVIHEGLKVEIEEKSSNWSFVTLADGKEGWIKEDEMRVL